MSMLLRMDTDQLQTSPERVRKPEVLLTDTNRWANAARLAVALANAGCAVSAVCPKAHPLYYTRAVKQVFPYSSLRPLEALRRAIASARPEIIVPCDDRSVGHLHELYTQAVAEGSAENLFVKLIERSLGRPDSYSVVSSRYDLLRTAREEGIRIPTTEPIRRPSDLDQWCKQHSLPCVLKADGTFGGRGVRVATTRERAKQLFVEMARPHPTLRVMKRLVVNRDPFWIRPWWNRARPPIIAQTFIKGRPANCTAFCWRGEVLAEIGVDVICSDGLTGPASVVRLIDNADMAAAARKIAKKLGLSGIFGLDFMIEEGTETTYLIEMNPRCTPLSHIQLGSGRDLAGALGSQLTGSSLRESPRITHKELIAYFPQAWTSKSELLDSSFQDIPRDEPELLKELLRPWPDRSLVYRIGHFFTATLVPFKSLQ